MFGLLLYKRILLWIGIWAIPVAMVAAQASSASPSNSQQTLPAKSAPSHADILRGAYGEYRANNDLLYYHLDIRVDPEKKYVSGKVTIRFKMLQDDNRIQLDLHEALAVDKILLGSTELKYVRELGTVWVDFPEMLRGGKTYSID